MAVASGEMVTEREVVLGGQPGPLVPRAVSWSLGEGWAGVLCGEGRAVVAVRMVERKRREGREGSIVAGLVVGTFEQLVKGFTMQIWREENSRRSQIGELKPYYKKQSLVEACKGSKEDSEAASPAEPLAAVTRLGVLDTIPKQKAESLTRPTQMHLHRQQNRSSNLGNRHSTRICAPRGERKV